MYGGGDGAQRIAQDCVRTGPAGQAALVLPSCATPFTGRAPRAPRQTLTCPGRAGRVRAGHVCRGAPGRPAAAARPADCRHGGQRRRRVRAGRRLLHAHPRVLVLCGRAGPGRRARCARAARRPCMACVRSLQCPCDFAEPFTCEAGRCTRKPMRSAYLQCRRASHCGVAIQVGSEQHSTQSASVTRRFICVRKSFRSPGLTRALPCMQGSSRRQGGPAWWR
jgi:hypothetical protein